MSAAVARSGRIGSGGGAASAWTIVGAALDVVVGSVASGAGMALACGLAEGSGGSVDDVPGLHPVTNARIHVTAPVPADLLEPLRALGLDGAVT